MKKLFCSVSLIFIIWNLSAQKNDSLKSTQEEIIKTGWNFGAVPAIAYDSDIGFKYGGVVNFYHYGDGSTYPKYLHSVYLEWSRTTNVSGINQFIYDSEYLIPGIRVTGEASLLTEKALDFYGFNGYKAYYDAAYEDDESNDYISRMYYRHERMLTRLKLDLQGKIREQKIRWLGGLVHYGIKIDSVDIENLNEGLDEAELLPDTSLLYNQFVNYGIIPEKQADGGNTNFLKLGLVYDTRDNEPNPMQGIWTEMLFLAAPAFLGNDYSFTRLAITHRQYFTLIPKDLNLAYRVSYQGKLSGEMPFYMLPFVYNSDITRDGLGGAKTIRGVLRNRVVGEDFLYHNLELRWKFFRTLIMKQNFYFALNTFLDGGVVINNYDFNTNQAPANFFEKQDSEGYHLSYGAGLHIAMNQNFVVACNYGRAFDPRDGNSGLYIGLNFLF